jgi:hypothetical protein
VYQGCSACAGTALKNARGGLAYTEKKSQAQANCAKKWVQRVFWLAFEPGSLQYPFNTPQILP